MWELLDAVYYGDRAWLDYKPDGTISPKANTKRFLPQLPGESNSEYQQRLVMSHFSDKFAKTCRDFMGLVFSHGVRLVDVPREIIDHWESLDAIGTRGDRHSPGKRNSNPAVSQYPLPVARGIFDKIKQHSISPAGLANHSPCPESQAISMVKPTHRLPALGDYPR